MQFGQQKFQWNLAPSKNEFCTWEECFLPFCINWNWLNLVLKLFNLSLQLHITHSNLPMQCTYAAARINLNYSLCFIPASSFFFALVSQLQQGARTRNIALAQVELEPKSKCNDMSQSRYWLVAKAGFICRENLFSTNSKRDRFLTAAEWFYALE